MIKVRRMHNAFIAAQLQAQRIYESRGFAEMDDYLLNNANITQEERGYTLLNTMIMNTISKKYIEDHLVDTYGGVKPQHDPKLIAAAIRITANELELNKKDLFHFIVDQANTIPMALSYGFQTAYGRMIMNTFTDNYENL